MKKLIYVILAIWLTNGLIAQEYKPFKGSYQLGFGQFSGSESGLVSTFELGYRITYYDMLTFKYESFSASRDLGVDEFGQNPLLHVFGLGWNRYLIEKGRTRFYGGLGFGTAFYNDFYIVEGPKRGSGFYEVVSAGSSFIFYPRVGLDIGHLNLVLEYNFVGNTEFSYTARLRDGNNTITEEVPVVLKNNFIAFKIGFSIGGGRN